MYINEQQIYIDTCIQSALMRLYACMYMNKGTMQTILYIYIRNNTYIYIYIWDIRVDRRLHTHSTYTYMYLYIYIWNTSIYNISNYIKQLQMILVYCMDEIENSWNQSQLKYQRKMVKDNSNIEMVSFIYGTQHSNPFVKRILFKESAGQDSKGSIFGITLTHSLTYYWHFNTITLNTFFSID